MFRTIMLSAAFLGACGVVQAQEDYVVLKTFKVEPPYTVSAAPSPLVEGRDGNFYGRNGYGVFKVTPDGSFSTLGDVLLSATAIDGGDGYFYAVTKPNAGTAIVKFTESGPATIIYQFSNASQGSLVEPIVLGTDGQLYGIIRRTDGIVSGQMFRLTTDGALTFLHTFPWNEEAQATRLVRGTDGDFYGVTRGRVFRATLDGIVTTLHAFTGGPGGSNPLPYLLQASDGWLYGSTTGGGAAGAGTIFKVRPDGVFSVIHSFPGFTVNGIDRVTAAFIEGSDGNLFGTSDYTVFRVTPAGDLRVLHSTFTAYPGWAGNDRYGGFLTGVVEGTNGNLYGTARTGGPDGDGVLFRLNRQRSPCANLIDPAWQPYNGGTLYLLGAVKTETPGFYGTWLVTQSGVAPVWINLTPAIDPTFSFEVALPLASTGTVGVFTLVVTSNLNVCADWKPVDTGGTGPTPAALQRPTLSKGGHP